MAGDRTVPRGVSRPGPSRRLADRSRLRSCAALLFVPALALALNYATSEPSSTSYVLELYALAARDVVALTPYVAVSATWEIATLRLLWARMPVTRNVAAVVAARLTLPVLGGLVIHTVVMAVVVRRGVVASFPGWSIPVLVLLQIVAWTCFGAALAVLFRQIIAIPLAVIVPFLALAVPSTVALPWPRHLTGNLFDCCGTDTILNPVVAVASSAALGCLAVLSICVALVRLSRSPWEARRRLAIAAVPALASVIALMFVVQPVTRLGYQPTLARPASELVCRSGVCLWPEDESARAANTAAWTTVGAAWRSLGLALPPVEAGPINSGSIVGVTTRSPLDGQAVTTIADSLPRELTDCPQDFSDQQRNVRLDQLSYLLFIAAGGSPAAGRPKFLSLTGAAVPTRAEAVRLWSAVGRCG